MQQWHHVTALLSRPQPRAAVAAWPSSALLPFWVSPCSAVPRWWRIALAPGFVTMRCCIASIKHARSHDTRGFPSLSSQTHVRATHRSGRFAGATYHERGHGAVPRQRLHITEAEVVPPESRGRGRPSEKGIRTLGEGPVLAAPGPRPHRGVPNSVAVRTSTCPVAAV